MALNIQNNVSEQGLSLLTANDLLSIEWPEPPWAIPQLLPVGLSILAGKPKAGKSWLALQLSKAISSGGNFLGKKIDAGKTLYLALEDPPYRLSKRMKLQGWDINTNAEFMPISEFDQKIGLITKGGGLKLAKHINEKKYRLVVIDTFSRSIPGDQKLAHEMTRALTPIQETAHYTNSAVLLIDHHRKGNGFDADAISDILGSTAKSAMADTVWGLYRERGKAGAKLYITGREVEEKTLSVNFNKDTFLWELDGNGSSIKMTSARLEIIRAVEELGSAKASEISNFIKKNKGNTYKSLQELVHHGLINCYKQDDDMLYSPIEK